MKPKHRQHDVALTFSKPVTVQEARAYLARAMKALDAFAVLSEMAWSNAAHPKIAKTAVRRRK